MPHLIYPVNRIPMEGDSQAAMQSSTSDRAALQDFWQEHRRWVAAVILAYKPRSVDLEDLLQEVAMTLVAKVKTVRDPANLRAWLRVVAVNAARAAGRSERLRRTVSADSESIESIAAQPARLEHADHSRHLMQRVLQLPEEYREPLLLKVQGLRSRQIAQMLDINEATVDTRVSRARRMLREMMEVNEGPEMKFDVTRRTNGVN